MVSRQQVNRCFQGESDDCAACFLEVILRWNNYKKEEEDRIGEMGKPNKTFEKLL